MAPASTSSSSSSGKSRVGAALGSAGAQASAMLDVLSNAGPTEALMYGCAALGAAAVLRAAGDVAKGAWKHLLRPRRDLLGRYGGPGARAAAGTPSAPWAIVTGGADGIGRAYAEELAKDGFNLILIDKDSDRLAEANTTLTESCGVGVATSCFDFAALGTQAGWEDLEDRLKALVAGRDVAVLVNNVAEFQHKLLKDADWPYILRATNVNCHSYAAMAKFFVPMFLERYAQKQVRSAIINVGTCAAEPQNPRFQFALYGATKAYTHILSSALREVYQWGDKGIDVMTSVPRQTSTRMNPAGFLFTVTPQTQAKAVIDQLGYESQTYGPLIHCLEYNLRFKYTLGFGIVDKLVQRGNRSRNLGLIAKYDARKDGERSG